MRKTTIKLHDVVSFSILYLVQAEGKLPSIYKYLKTKELVLLSYRYDTDDTTIFCPKSTWTSGRNKLREYALSLDRKYTYYVFLDEDLVGVGLSQKKMFQTFEDSLEYLDDPIVTPDTWGYNSRVARDDSLPQESIACPLSKLFISGENIHSQDCNLVG